MKGKTRPQCSELVHCTVTWTVMWWSTDHHERLTRYCHRVEEIEVVLPVVVVSETEVRGGRRELLKLLTCAVFVAASAPASPAMEKKILLGSCWRERSCCTVRERGLHRWEEELHRRGCQMERKRSCNAWGERGNLQTERERESCWRRSWGRR